MGTLRLVLAIAVLLSHADVRVAQLNPGVMAVIGFYLISGYVMAGLIQRHYGALARAPHFYLDRLLRLYPQYLVIALAALVWHWISGAHNLFLTRPPTLQDIFNNLAIIPMNFFMWNGSDAYALIPPSWSLGAEIQFYLLAPLLILFPRIGLVAALFSLLVQVLAWLGVLHADWWGYRLLPGVLWFFLLGAAVHNKRLATLLAWASPLLALGVYMALRAKGLHAVPYHTEVLIGWGLGAPLLWIAARLPRSGWDEQLGDLAYGVFLNHFLLLWVFWGGKSPSGPIGLMLLVAASIALSWLVQRFIEQPVVLYRRHLRRG